ncbi:hypothetical protein [Metasolibacillus sp.]|uniref:hypothetical protein n=1 Tax=Metasolibacillus sp. TaxID=2703680 RepID=UPI0025E1C8DE|nr:hypothetical protein [Metasolibacillus sp.]MCT6922791.1 hypothetical protein [Metasolibacillus sp.]MCT6938870.1 hypothetical protein [Metasolibacillus sp.]
MRFRKKHIEIEAIQWNGENNEEIMQFLGMGDAGDYFLTKKYIGIHTLEGIMKASVGDYIIKGIQGEFSPCKPDIFEQNYEKI